MLRARQQVHLKGFFLFAVSFQVSNLWKISLMITFHVDFFNLEFLIDAIN